MNGYLSNSFLFTCLIHAIPHGCGVAVVARSAAVTCLTLGPHTTEALFSSMTTVPTTAAAPCLPRMVDITNLERCQVTREITENSLMHYLLARGLTVHFLERSSLLFTVCWRVRRLESNRKNNRCEN